jgi:sortase A
VSLRALRVTGWTLIAAGLLVLLYVVYALWFTGLETERAQTGMAREWEQSVAVGAGDDETPEVDAGAPAELEGGERPREPIGEDGAVAKLEFVRPGSDERPVVDEPLFVVDGVGHEALTRGPGHYPRSALPGDDGNFAVAGHRTTYGAPFFALDELERGDRVRVTDRAGRRHVYEIAEQTVVLPGESWVLGEDPLDTGRPTLTLTTCHPRFSAAKRLIVFGELVS